MASEAPVWLDAAARGTGAGTKASASHRVVDLQIDKAFFDRLTDWLMVAVAATLPWSTSGTSICLVAWLIAFVFSSSAQEVGREARNPSSALPVAIGLLALVGMVWTIAPLRDAIREFESFAKLLVVPLLVVQFRRSPAAGMRVLLAFLLACLSLVAVSVASFVWTSGPWWWIKMPGVPVKDYIQQSALLVVGGFGAAHVALSEFQNGRNRRGLLFAASSLALLSDPFLIVTSRTAIMVLPALGVLFLFQRFPPRAAAALTLGLAILAGAIVWSGIGTFQKRADAVVAEIQEYEKYSVPTSAGQRLAFWNAGIRAVVNAPLIGYGTGSIWTIFARAGYGTELRGPPLVANAHNQLLNLAVQFGVGGAVLLLLMWATHLKAFRSTGLECWWGMGLVVQNIVSCMANSHLSDFGTGWMYVIGVGLLLGTKPLSVAASGTTGVPASSSRP